VCCVSVSCAGAWRWSVAGADLVAVGLQALGGRQASDACSDDKNVGALRRRRIFRALQRRHPLGLMTSRRLLFV
jgi:hypothetical protein